MAFILVCLSNGSVARWSDWSGELTNAEMEEKNLVQFFLFDVFLLFLLLTNTARERKKKNLISTDTRLAYFSTSTSFGHVTVVRRLGFIFVRVSGDLSYSRWVKSSIDNSPSRQAIRTNKVPRQTDIDHGPSHLRHRSSDHHLQHLSVATWTGLANLEEPRCYRSLSRCLCLADISKRWDFVAWVRLQFSRLLVHVFAYLDCASPIGRMCLSIDEHELREPRSVGSICNWTKAPYDSMLDKWGYPLVLSLSILVCSSGLTVFHRQQIIGR